MKNFTKLSLQLEPKPKQRPRAFVRASAAQVKKLTGKALSAYLNKCVKIYTPADTKDAEREIARQCAGMFKITGQPVILAVRVRIPKPKTCPSWRSRASKLFLWFPRGGDLDNYVKLLKDALNGVAWEDDSQVVGCISLKVEHEHPGYDIMLWECSTVDDDVHVGQPLADRSQAQLFMMKFFSEFA